MHNRTFGRDVEARKALTRTMKTTVLGSVAALMLVACSVISPDGSDETQNGVTPAPAGNPNGADVGGECKGPDDCKSGICVNSVCQPSTPRDGIRNGDESDVDCGGSVAPKCLAGKGCGAGADCASGVCKDGKCEQGAPDDGVKNGDETDVDCGGVSSPKCATGKSCLEAVSCESGICTNGTCATPSPTDGVKNGAETDVDCGGGGEAPACAVGKSCAAGGDCETGSCKEQKCVSPSADDGVKNGTETDVDCGGEDVGTPRCATGKTCNIGADCASVVCTGKKCAAPTGTDGVKNGDESDVDCGGTQTGAPKCAVNKACKVHADCASDGCAYNGKCALRKSCTRQHGGDTCGSGELGEAGANHESCCTTITFNRNGQTISLDKYDITAGRMRAFAERTNGNLRAAVTGLAGFPQQWHNFLPSNVDELNARLGPAEVFEEAPRIQGQRMVDGCYIAGQGMRTWWAPEAGDGTKMGRDPLDQKALNCVNLYMLYALCAWEGGRLPTSAEYQAAWRGPDNRSYPWGNTLDNSRMIHNFNYFYPYANGAGQNCNQNGACDNSVFLAAPGRRPTGYGPYGHADLAGEVFNVVWDGDYAGKWIWTGSWEGHVPQAQAQVADLRARPRYWAMGGRCAR